MLLGFFLLKKKKSLLKCIVSLEDSFNILTFFPYERKNASLLTINNVLHCFTSAFFN